MVLLSTEHLQQESQNSPQANFEVLSPIKFKTEIQKAASQAKNKVWMQAMYFEPGNFATSIQDMLTSARQRGVDTRLQFDEYSIKVQQEIPNYFPTFGRKRRMEKRAILTNQLAAIDDLRNQDVKVTLLHTMSPTENIFPFKGRNHAKIIVIDNTAWMGGVNFTDGDINRFDFMVRITDPQLVTALTQTFQDFGEGRLDKDRVVTAGDTMLLIDAGKSGQSIILDTALQAIDKAQESIRHTSQYTPNGRLAKAFKQATEKGVITEVIVPQTKALESLPNKALDFVNRQKARLGRAHFHLLDFPTHIHSKLLLIDAEGRDSTNTTLAMIGSNNLTETGIRFGTAEIALASTNPKLIENLNAYWDSVKEKVVTEE